MQLTDEQFRELLRGPTPWYETFRKWLPTIISLIILIGAIAGPFNNLRTDVREIKDDVDLIEYYIFSTDKEQDLIENPFMSRGVPEVYIRKTGILLVKLTKDK